MIKTIQYKTTNKLLKIKKFEAIIMRMSNSELGQITSQNH